MDFFCFSFFFHKLISNNIIIFNGLDQIQITQKQKKITNIVNDILNVTVDRQNVTVDR